MQNVPPAEWQRMCENSRYLLGRAEQALRIGDAQRHAKVWAELRPLNQRIRALSTYPADGSPRRRIGDGGTQV